MAQQPEWLSKIVQARFLVGALGETAAPPWWRSDASSSASLRFLERLYPRTFLVASLETMARAAASEHDAHIGAAGSYHLFRLPVAEEMALHEYLQAPPVRGELQTLADQNSRATYLAALRDLAHGEQVERGIGPVSIGPLSGLHTDGMLRRMCAIYADAFAQGHAAYPYVTKEVTS